MKNKNELQLIKVERAYEEEIDEILFDETYGQKFTEQQLTIHRVDVARRVIKAYKVVVVDNVKSYELVDVLYDIMDSYQEESVAAVTFVDGNARVNILLAGKVFGEEDGLWL